MARTVKSAHRVRGLLGIAGILCTCLGQAGAGEKEPAKTKIFPRVTSGMLESVLKDLDLTFKKEPEKPGEQAYVFQRGDTRIRLVNYNGEDLWIEAVLERKLALAQSNNWNASAKYSRCVLLEGDGKASVSLEMQLDCIKGATPGMVRQFLIRFGGELREFQALAGKEKKK
jgi:hypothetical protein